MAFILDYPFDFEQSAVFRMSGGRSTDLSRVDVGSNFSLSTSGYLHKPLQRLPSLINSVDQSKWRKILKGYSTSFTINPMHVLILIYFDFKID